MTELKYKSVFERKYLGLVGLGGLVEDSPEPFTPKNEIRPQTYEDILAEYRAYIGDQQAELPEEILEELRKFGKI